MPPCCRRISYLAHLDGVHLHPQTSPPTDNGERSGRTLNEMIWAASAEGLPIVTPPEGHLGGACGRTYVRHWRLPGTKKTYLKHVKTKSPECQCWQINKHTSLSPTAVCENARSCSWVYSQGDHFPSPWVFVKCIRRGWEHGNTISTKFISNLYIYIVQLSIDCL